MFQPPTLEMVISLNEQSRARVEEFVQGLTIEQLAYRCWEAKEAAASFGKLNIATDSPESLAAWIMATMADMKLHELLEFRMRQEQEVKSG